MLFRSVPSHQPTYRTPCRTLLLPEVSCRILNRSIPTLRRTPCRILLLLDFDAGILGIASSSPNLAARDIEPRILRVSDSLMTNENAHHYKPHPKNVKANLRRVENR